MSLSWLKQWVKSTFPASGQAHRASLADRSPSRRRPFVRPMLEHLEDRRLLSGTGNVSLVLGPLGVAPFVPSFTNVGFQQNVVGFLYASKNNTPIQGGSSNGLSVQINWGGPGQLPTNGNNAPSLVDMGVDPQNADYEEYEIKGSYVYQQNSTGPGFAITVNATYGTGADTTSTSGQTDLATVTSMPSHLGGTQPNPVNASPTAQNVSISLSPLGIAPFVSSYDNVGFQQNLVGYLDVALNNTPLSGGSSAGITAQINWGDTTSWYSSAPTGGNNAPTVSLVDMGVDPQKPNYEEYEIRGSYVYQQNSTGPGFAITVYATGPDATSTSGQTDSATVTSNPNPTGIGSPQADPINPTAGDVFNLEVAQFAPADGNATPDQFTAETDWGDGDTTKDTVESGGPGGTFMVSADYTYPAGDGGQTFSVRTTITDDVYNRPDTVQEHVNVGRVSSPPSPNPSPITFSPPDLPDGIVGQQYAEQDITASNSSGDLPLSYTITAGAIPNGMHFTLGDPFAGGSQTPLSITGTPQAGGSVAFTVTALDGSGKPLASQDYVLTIVPVSSAPSGITPAQIRTAYGINNIKFGSVAGDGTGQTIAIVIHNDDPSIFDDVDAFDKQFGTTSTGPSLYDQKQYGPAKNFLTVLNQNGQPADLPSPNPTCLEESMDVEWAHAIAPGAKIIVVEANSSSLSDMMAAVLTARNQSDVSVVSYSLGSNEAQTESNYESYFKTPAGHKGETFLAAIGETGSPGNFPAALPSVVAVGGTSLNVDANGQRQSENGWTGNLGGVSPTSPYEHEPPYQLGVQSTGWRQVPDVAANASQAPIYDSALGGTTPWEGTGLPSGTSLATPIWAGLIAIADQGRVAATQNPNMTLDGLSQTLPALYSAPTAYFYPTGPNRYNTGTGLGAPVADQLVPYLANYGLTPPAPAPTPNPTPPAPPVTPPTNNPPPQASNPIDQIIAEIQQLVAGIEAEIQQLVSAEMAILSSLLGSTPKA